MQAAAALQEAHESRGNSQRLALGAPLFGQNPPASAAQGG